MTLKRLIICMCSPLPFLSFLLFVLDPFISPCLYAQSTQHSALMEGAKKEGKLVWYTSMAVDTSKPLLDAFVKEYPFIQAELVRLGEEQLMNRVLSRDPRRPMAVRCHLHQRHGGARGSALDYALCFFRARRVFK